MVEPGNLTKVTAHMVSSLDGYIAAKDNRVEWMNSKDRFDQGVTLSKEEITAFLENIDCYVMGSRTYEHALELGWPYGDTPVFVFTQRSLPKKYPNVHFLTGDLNQVMQTQLKSDHCNIWVVGGSNLIRQFIQFGLVDELIVTIVPVILGDGQPFFESIEKEQPLHLKNVRAYTNGMVELTYSFQLI